MGRGAAWTLAALAVPVLLLGALAWLAGTAPGLQAAVRLAALASGGRLVLEGAEGRLAGPLQVASLSYTAPDLRISLRALSLDWQPGALLEGRLVVLRLAAGELAWAAAPSAEPATPPADLRLPLALELKEVAVALIRVLPWDAAEDASAPVFELRDLAGRLVSDGQVHRLEAASARSVAGELSLEGRLDGAAPFHLAARLGLKGARDGRAYSLAGEVQGDLLATRLSLAGEGAGLRGEARVLATPFAPVPLGEVRLRIAEFDPAVLDPSWPAAALAVEASLAPPPGQSPAASLSLAGPLVVTNRRPRPADQGGLPVERLAASLAWSPAGLELGQIELRLAGGGRVSGAARWAPGAEGPGRGEARLKVAELNLRSLDSRLLATRLAGQLSGQGDAQGQALEAELADARFQLQLSARQAGEVLALERLRLKVGPGTLEGRGRADLKGERAFELAGRMGHFDPRAVYAEAPAGDLNLDFAARGRFQEGPAGKLDFKLAASRLAGRPLAGEGALELAPDRLAVPRLWLAVADNRLEAEGAFGRSGEQLRLRLAAPRLDALGEGYGGRLEAEGQLSGTLADPAGSLSATGQQVQVPGQLRIGTLNLQGRLGAGADGAVSLILGASRLGRPGAQADWLDSLALQVGGTRASHSLSLQAARGRQDRWQARLEGGWQAGAWQGRVQEISGEGSQPLRLEAPASLALGREGVALGPATVHAGEGVIHLRETRWSPAATVLRGDLRGLGFGLVATDGGPLRRGGTTLRLGAEWDLRLAERFDGEARLYRESGDLVLIGDAPARLGLEAFELRFTARDNRLAVGVQARGSQLGALAASATAAAEKGPDGWRLAPQGALVGAAHLAMPSITWLGPLTQPGLATEGALEADFDLSGTPASPVGRGRVRGSRLGLSLADLGLRLSQGSLVAEFDRDQLRLASLEFLTPNQVQPREGRLGSIAAVGGAPGRLVASGAVDLASGAGRFSFSAARLPLLQRVDRWLMASGQGEVRTGWNEMQVEARLQADAGFLGLAERPAPSLSDDVVVLGRGEAGASTPFRFSLDATVDLGPQLYLSMLGVDTRLEGSLRLRSRDGHPLAATGTVTTVGGVYAGYGQNLSIERGRVSFAGPLDNPALNVVALRKGLAVEAGVAISGTAQRPKVTLVSEPNVPDAEKLSWIVLGRPPDTASGGDMGLLIPAAQALLGGPGGGITAQLAGSLGLDQLTVGQEDLSGAPRPGGGSRVLGRGLNSAPTVSGQVLSLGKRLSNEAFVSFEQSLGGAESIVKLTYQLSRQLAVVARGGTDNAVDLSYSLSFR